MIKTVNIAGLKSISKLSLNCKNLNIIAGANSSGKSTVLQAILLAAQNGYGNVGFNGNYITLGEFKDAKNFNISERKIRIAFDISSGYMVNLEFDEDGISRNDLFDLTSFGIASPKLPVIRYLSCNRIGAEDIYRKKFSDDKNVGINGEYAIYCLDKYKSENVADEIVREPKSYTLFSQVNYWLNYILETSITTEDVVGTDFVKCFYTTPEGKQIRPKNTGAGLSYLISVLVLCLLSDKNDIIVIENPEIHLHPKAQSKVCEFLYFIAKSGRQLFVETHSDHIFNGVRAGIATQKMQAEKIAVNFFSIDSTTKCTQNTVIEFGKRGRILTYVEGLFDQFDIDLNRMLDI